MDAVEEIKGRLSVDDVVGRYVDLKRSGGTLKGLCPFHQEKTPSFIVSPSRGTFHCFGCGRGGDIFTFVMEIERSQFPDALKQLAEQAGVTLPEREKKAPSLKGRLHEAHELAAKFFTDTLLGPPGDRGRAYLKGRGFGREAVEIFHLGIAPTSRDMLVQHLRNQGFDDRVILAAGLAYQDDTGGALRDRFRGRLMFPIRDASGKISGFGGRALDNDQQPKYLNSPQTEIFDKSSVLFGIHLAGDAIRKSGRAVLVEGYLDAVRAHIAGYRDTVASLGTAVTHQQLHGLSRWTQKVIVALDPDPAGQAAAARTSLSALAEITRARGRQEGGAGALELRIARLPDARDPDELIQGAPEAWESALSASIPAFDFYFEQTIAGLDRVDDGWRQSAIDQLLPVIQQFGDSVAWQATWLERLSGATGIDPRALERSIQSPRSRGGQGTRRRESRPANDIVSTTNSRALTADHVTEMERALLSLVLAAMVVPAPAREQLRDVEPGRGEHRAILNAILAWQSNENYDYQMFRETLPENLREMTDELRGRDVPLPDDGKMSVAIGLHVTRLRHFRVLAQLDRVRHILDDASPEDRVSIGANLARLMAERRENEETLDKLSRLVLQSGTSGFVPQGTIDQDSGRL